MRKGRLLLIALCLSLLLPAAASAREVSTSAKACVVIDAASGRVLLEHNAHEALPMASTTKVMTALIALERGSLADTVVAGRNAFGVPGTSIYLDLGESLTLEQMLYGLMMQSGNDAAVAIAEHIGGTVDDFCAMMTARARELGCEDTVFLTPHGLPCDGHHTTARDLALIAREAMGHEVFRRIVSTQRATIPWAGRPYDRVLRNKNRLLAEYDGATGIKTGFTRAAGRCLVSSATRGGMSVICVVLNCGDWFNESARLMDLAFAEWESVTLLLEGECLRRIPVEAGEAGEVRALLQADLTGLVPRGALPQVEIHLPGLVEAPVQAGQVLGEARLTAAGETVAVSPLVAGEAVPRNDFPARWRRCWRLWPALAAP